MVPHPGECTARPGANLAGGSPAGVEFWHVLHGVQDQISGKGLVLRELWREAIV